MRDQDDIERAEMEAEIAYQLWNELAAFVAEEQARAHALRVQAEREEARDLREARKLGIQVVTVRSTTP